MRTILAPGVQISEIDKSQHAPAMAGTRVLTMGFANKGEDYQPMEFTSRSAWLNYYGEPDNEAERYFYTACMEVINQNGILYCAKLPYDNEAKDKVAFKKYKINNPNGVKVIGDVTNYVDQNGFVDLLDGRYARYGYNPQDDLSNMTETSAIYGATIMRLEEYGETLAEYNKAKHVGDTTLPYCWIETASEEDDDWRYYRQDSIYGRLLGVFDESGAFWSKYSDHAFSELNLSALAECWKNEISPGEEFDGAPEKYVNAFKTAYELAFGKEATELEPWNFIYSKLATSESSYLRDFLADNAEVFTAIQGLTPEQDVDDYGYSVPWFYWEEGKCNLMAYYTAAVNAKAAAEFDKGAVATAINGIGRLYGDHTVDGKAITIPEVDPYVDLAPFFADSIGAGLNEAVEETVTAETLDDKVSSGLVTELVNDVNEFVNDVKVPGGFEAGTFKKLLKSFSAAPACSNQYVLDVIAYYRENANITSFYDQVAIKKATNLADLLHTYEDDVADETDKRTGPSYFSRYGSGTFDEDGEPVFFEDDEIAIAKLLEAFNKDRLTKGVLVDYVNEIKASDDYAAVSAVAIAGNENLKKFDEEAIYADLAYSEIRFADPTCKQYFEIGGDTDASYLDLTELDEYRTGEALVPPNSMYVVDITRAPYGKTGVDSIMKEGDKRELVGIVPVVTTAANALVAQSLIDVADGESFEAYNSVDQLWNVQYANEKTGIAHDAVQMDPNLESAIPFASDSADDTTLAQTAAQSFASIALDDAGGFDRENLTKIGLVVFRAYVDSTEGNKISYTPVEAFVGDLDRTAKNPSTGASQFIDTIVNSQSEYVNFFSNCFNTTGTKKKYDEDCDILIMPPTKAAALGFYEDMVKEDISLKTSVLGAMDRVFDKVADINERDIDIVVDGGVSNIAQYIKTVFGNGKGAYDPTSTEAAMFKLKSRAATLTWRTVIQKLDNFCKNVRKDCMFVADGLRPLCLQGNQKIVRPSKPSNTIDANILPYMKFITGVNTSYGAGYCDWFQLTDEFTGDYFWCPPSIKAAGIYIYTDTYYNYWDAPAGLNRGIVGALDVAFSPTNKQAGSIYEKAWNYAINYPYDGITLEGQKTFQVKPSAFDRVNVRRLFLRLERQTYKVSRYFEYEGNTAYTRQRFIDTITPVFESAKIGGGVYDYKIICDESINTAEVIDNDELRCKIGIKPTKTAEFILIDFIALRTGGSFSEM